MRHLWGECWHPAPQAAPARKDHRLHLDAVDRRQPPHRAASLRSQSQTAGTVMGFRERAFASCSGPSVRRSVLPLGVVAGKTAMGARFGRLSDEGTEVR